MTDQTDNDRYLTTAAASQFTGFAIGTLMNWRSQGRGPAYSKSRGNTGAVRYRLADLKAFMAARTHVAVRD